MNADKRKRIISTSIATLSTVLINLALCYTAMVYSDHPIGWYFGIPGFTLWVLFLIINIGEL